jgi:hypothetical protein
MRSLIYKRNISVIQCFDPSQSYMEEHIVSQPHGKLNTFIHRRRPTLGRSNVDDLLACLNISNNCEAWKRRPHKGYCAPQGREVSDNHKSNLILSLF